MNPRVGRHRRQNRTPQDLFFAALYTRGSCALGRGGSGHGKLWIIDAPAELKEAVDELRVIALTALLLVAACGALERPPDLGYRCANDAAPAETNAAERQKRVGMPCPIPTDRSIDCSGQPDRTPPPEVTVACERKP